MPGTSKSGQLLAPWPGGMREGAVWTGLQGGASGRQATQSSIAPTLKGKLRLREGNGGTCPTCQH